MGKQFAIIIKDKDLTEDDIYVAMEQYVDGMLENREIDKPLEFEIRQMD